MSNQKSGYTVLPYPRNRLLMVDGGQLARRRHTVHGLVEFDITDVHATLQRQKAETGEATSFAAFFLGCLGQAIDADRQVQAYRNWRNQLILFDEVDVNMLFEVEVEGVKTIRPHILRGVNHRTTQALHTEIRTFQREHHHSQESKFIEAFVRLPGVARRLFLQALFRNPQRLKELYGTVLVTSIGMFGTGSGWGIPMPNHTLQLTLGGVGIKPGVVANRVEVRRYLSVTVSFDHDIVDGAPAARFIDRLRRLVEEGYGLGDRQPPVNA